MAKKPRDVSSEERRQWREETARDALFHAELQELTGDEVPATPKAKAIVKSQRTPSPSATTRTKPEDVRVGDLSRLDPKSAKAFTKETKRRDGALDLHDMNQDEAYRAITRFIAKAEREGWRNLRIITGKGARSGGILREKVTLWLNSPPFTGKVLALSHGAPREGGEGVLLVLLKRTR